MDVPALVCFDLPCLVDVPPDVTADALDRAVRRLGVEAASPLHGAVLTSGVRWPGREARAALGRVFGSDVWADAAAAAFDDAFGACAVRRGVSVKDGARDVVGALRDAGAAICITTEFSAATREAVLDVLGWQDLVAMLVSADPFEPSLQQGLVEAAIGRLGVRPSDCAVVADTCSGVAAGRQAGAGWVVGVLGRADRGDLHLAGATAVAHLPELVPTALAGRLLPA